MKKRLWIVSTLVPLLLIGGLFWIRHLAWQRLKEDFRGELLHNATADAERSFVVAIEKPTDSLDLGAWKPEQIKEFLADVHLQKATPRSPDEGGDFWLRFETFYGEPDPDSGFSIALDGEENFVGGVRSSQQFSQKWGKVELTPESARVLKKRVIALYGKQIEAFQNRKP